jgi:hypothetical protein
MAVKHSLLPFEIYHPFPKYVAYLITTSSLQQSAEVSVINTSNQNNNKIKGTHFINSHTSITLIFIYCKHKATAA